MIKLKTQFSQILFTNGDELCVTYDNQTCIFHRQKYNAILKGLKDGILRIDKSKLNSKMKEEILKLINKEIDSAKLVTKFNINSISGKMLDSLHSKKGINAIRSSILKKTFNLTKNAGMLGKVTHEKLYLTKSDLNKL